MTRGIARNLLRGTNQGVWGKEVPSVVQGQNMLMLMDILRALDAGDLTLLSYGIRGASLGWFTSYLNNRFQYVCCGPLKSTPTMVLCGVPQGSVLGPVSYTHLTLPTNREV